MSEQKQSRSFNKLARLLAPVGIAALLLVGGISVMRAHAAPTVSGNYNFRASVKTTGLLSQNSLKVTGQLDLSVSGQNVRGKLCNVKVTLSSGLLNTGTSLLNDIPLSGLLSNGLLSGLLGNGLVTLSGGSSVCLNVTGTVTGTGAITMTILNLLPGLPLNLSGLHNPDLGAHGGLAGKADLDLGLLQLNGSWSATLKVSH